jgi:kynurenine formamidase
MVDLPDYAELKNRDDAPAGSAWGLFGREDDIGLLNILTSEKVLQAARLVRHGTIVNLDLPIDAFDPPIFPKRGVVRHHVFGEGFSRDDKLDDFYLQASSQIDGLRHVISLEHGYYNGFAESETQSSAHRLGIQRWSQRGIVGRGVLVDLERYFRLQGINYDPLSRHAFTVKHICDAAHMQGVEFAHGDILLLRTGWVAKALQLSTEERLRFHTRFECPGIEQSDEMVEWLWNQHFAMVAADNAMVERFPPVRDSPFFTPSEVAGGIRSPGSGLLHGILIPLLGMPLGELWQFDELANLCAVDDCWECMLIAKPLNVPGGVGSPSNALAIR